MIAAAIPQLEAFHRANGLWVGYLPPLKGERDRSGVVTEAKRQTPEQIKALINWTPTLEQVTAFGDPSRLQAGRRAVFRVLAADLCPDTAGSFTRGQTHYSIWAVNALERGGQVYCYDCLVGFE